MPENVSNLISLNDFHPDTQRFFNGKTVLATGGGGFIGSFMVEQLLMLGAKVTVVSRQTQLPFLNRVKEAITITQADLLDPVQTEQLFKQQSYDVVINMAAMVGGLEYNFKHPATTFHNNMLIFLNVIKAAHDHQVPYFTVCSSACIYPRYCTIPTPEEEAWKEGPEPTNAGYGWAKRMQEFLGAKYQEEFGMKVAIPRPYNAYGPRDNFEPHRSHVIPALIRKAMLTSTGEFDVWGDGSHSRGFIYVEDFARGVLEVTARYHCAEGLNIGADEEVRIDDLAHMIANYASEIRGEVIKPVFKPDGLTGQPRRSCDTRKARAAIDYKTIVSIEDGLKKTLQWWSEDENSPVHSHV